jgi:hypothetical protein
MDGVQPRRWRRDDVRDVVRWPVESVKPTTVVVVLVVAVILFCLAFRV